MLQFARRELPLRHMLVTSALQGVVLVVSAVALGQPDSSTLEIRHRDSDEAVGAARVVCAGVVVATADSTGRASGVTCPAPVRVEADGYVPLVVTLDSVEIRVLLVPEPAALQEVVDVSAPLLATQDVGIPAQVVLQATELAALRSSLLDDPLRAMQALPGVATSDDLRADFSVRGSPFRQVGIVLDDVKSRLLMHTVRGVEQTGSVALLNGDLVAAAALTAGGYPQRYGNSLGAELVVHTRDGRSDRVRGRLLTSAIATTATLEGPAGTDRVTWIAAVRKSYASWITTRIDPDLSGTFDFQDAQGRLAAQLGDGHLVSLSLLTGASVYDERGRRTAVFALDVGRNRTHMASARWQSTVSPTLLVSQRLTYISARFRNENPVNRVLDRGDERETLYRAAVTWAPAPEVSLDASVLVEGFRVDGMSVLFGGTAGPDGADLAFGGRTRRQGSHGHLRWTPPGPLRVGVGGRVDTVNGLGSTVSPWIQAEAGLSRHWFVQAATGQHAQAPDLLQRAGPFPAEALTYERARHLDVGIGWRRGGWSVQLAAFRRDERNVLDRPGAEPRLAGARVIPGDPLAPWVNTLWGRSRGIEAVMRHGSARWSGWVSYAYGRTQLESADGTAFAGAFDQRHVTSAAISARLAARWDGSITIRTSSNWPYAGYYFRPADDRVFLWSQRNTLRLPLYSRADMRVRRTVALPRGQLTLFGEAINVFNRRNLRQAAESVNLGTTEVRGLSEKQLPIIPSVGVSWEF